jgi:hypothetical protein
MGKPPVVPESLDFTEDASLDEGVFPASYRDSEVSMELLQAVFRIRIHRIHMFLGLPDPSIVKQK